MKKTVRRTPRPLSKYPPKRSTTAAFATEHYINYFDSLNNLKSGVTYTLYGSKFITSKPS